MKNKLIFYIKNFYIDISNIKIQILLVFLFIFFFFLGTLTINRIIRFLIILIIAIIYSRLLIYFDKYINTFYSRYIRELIELNKNYEIFIKILLKVNLWKNPLLFIIVKLEECIHDLLINLNSKSNNKLIWKLSYILILNFTLINPIKIIHYKFYNMLWNWRNDSIKNLLFKRIYGVILSVLIFTDIINYIYYIISGYEIIGIYIILIIIGLLCEVYMIAKRFSLNKDILTIYAIRANVTIIGLLLNILYKNFYYRRTDPKLMHYNTKYYYEVLWYHYGYMLFEKKFKFNEYYRFTKLQSLDRRGNVLYFRQYRNNISYIIHSFIMTNFDIMHKKVDWLYYEIYFNKLRENFKKSSKFHYSVDYQDYITFILDEDFDEKIKLIKNLDDLKFKLWLYLLWDMNYYLYNEVCNNLIIERGTGLVIYYLIKHRVESNEEEKFLSKLVDLKLSHKEDTFWDLNNNYKFYEKVYNYTFIYDDKEWEEYDKIYNETYKLFKYVLELIYGNGICNYAEATEEEYRYIEDQIESWKKEWLEESKLSLEERNIRRLVKVEKAINNLLFYNNKHRNDEGK